MSNVLWVGGVGKVERAIGLTGCSLIDVTVSIYISIFYNYFCTFGVFDVFNTFDALIETVLYLSNFLQSKYDFDYC